MIREMQLFKSLFFRQSSLTSPPASAFPSLTSPITSGPTASQSAATSQARSHTTEIATGVTGGVLGLVVIVTIALLVRRRRRKRRAAARGQASMEGHEKPQLHSDDIKPDRKELEGTRVSNTMRERLATEIAELSANEEVVRRDRLGELPSNEPTGHEMETTENEMAVLDRMVCLTESTALTSERNDGDRPYER
ncbi:hypothetical protein A1O1_05532 [Capronia coronata CBS 617.96]|uniref:receptor protein-tyrosine kinase n=1 Tax=Capronia coronata CBS 617.96 TaxID=1182541 RepID=W9Y6X9_9EURO|nr:uncharacterized protein A1O1_05532 [Capronia coronata CBS 617.96]EXJ88602.1 hypothetical protein A1O1_05532 [Capronia coronata CBS 617.96]